MKIFILLFIIIAFISCKSKINEIETNINHKKYALADQQLNEQINKQETKTLLDSTLIAKLYYLKGYYYIKKYNYKNAIPWFQKSLKFTEEQLTPNYKLHALHHLSNSYAKMFIKDSVMKYYDSTVAYAKSQNNLHIYTFGKLIIAHRLGYGSNNKANDYFNECNYLADSLNSALLKGKVKYVQAASKFIQLKFDSSIYYYTLAINEFEKESINEEIINAKNNIGECYRFIKNYQKALYYYNESYELALKENDEYRLSVACINIADIKFIINDIIGAKEFYLKSIEYGKVNDDIIAQMEALHTLGTIATIEKDYKSAYDYYIKNINLWKSSTFPSELITQTYEELVNLLIKTGDNQKALSYLDTLNKSNFILDDDKNRHEFDARLALQYSKLGYYEMAKKLALPLYFQADEIKNYPQKKDAAEALYNVYVNQGNIEKAHEYFKNYSIAKDSIYQQNKTLELGKLIAQIENKELFLKQEAKVEKLDSKLNNSNITKRYLFIIAFLSLLFSVFLYYLLSKNEKRKNELSIKNSIIQQQNYELLESNRNLHNFAQIAAHDINGPLKSIALLSKIIQAKYKNLFSIEDKETMSLIETNCNDLIAMINGLVNFSTITKNLLPPQAIDINEIVSHIIDNQQAQLQNKKLIVNIKHKLPLIKAHEFLIQQLFSNLIANCIKYSKPNKAIKIEIEGVQEHDFVKISVADNGIGIANEFQNKAFELFTKFHNSDEYEGSGIGLSTCKKIVNYYAGTIGLNSIPNEGTTIYFTLPKY